MEKISTLAERRAGIRAGLMFSLLLLCSLCCFGQQPPFTYTWVGAPGGKISTSTNWSPARSVLPNNPSRTDDILRFTGTSPITVQVDRDETIGRLEIENAEVTLLVDENRTTTRTITINGTSGSSFQANALSVSQQSILTVTSTDNDNSSLVIRLAQNAGATIGGRVIFNNTGPNPGNNPNNDPVSNHRLCWAGTQALGTEPIKFEDGSFLIMGARALGNPFLNPDNNATIVRNEVVLFKDGASFNQLDGGTPFPTVKFEKRSFFRFFNGATQPSFAGRTYGNLVIQTRRDMSSIGGTGWLTVLNNLTLTDQNVSPVDMNMSGPSGGVRVGGSIYVGGGTLTFNPNSPAELIINDGVNSSKPRIEGRGNISFGQNVKITVEDPDGVMLMRDATVRGGLRLSGGKLEVMPGVSLVVPAERSGTTPLIETSNGNYIIGSLTRTLEPNSLDILRFPIGDTRSSAGLELRITRTNPAVTHYTAEVKTAAAPQLLFKTGAVAKRVSRVRYFETSTTHDNIGNASLTIDYTPTDEVDNLSKLRIVKSEDFFWVDLGGQTPPDAEPGARNSLTQPYLTGRFRTTVPFNQLGAFSLASTESAATPGNNPLPVELLLFTATAHEKGAMLRWATATEKNSAYFEVQRSTDGQQFSPIATVEAAGNSTTLRRYSLLDESVPSGTVFYRLRQVDQDGTASLSRIVTINKPGKLDLSLYPNPAEDQLRLLTGAEAVQWTMYNGLGQVVQRGNAAGATTLDVVGLPAGVYFLQVQTDKEKQVRRFVKK